MGRVAVLGSLNVDLVTRVGRHPAPGETVVGRPLGRFAGGNGARLAAAGVELAVARVEGAPTGTAYITVDDAGENTIVVVPGANAQVGQEALDPVRLGPGDVLLCSLEVPTDVVARAALAAHRVGARVVLNLAPYAGVLPDAVAVADPVVVNESEMRALADSGLMPTSLLVTFGAAGASWDGEQVEGLVVPAAEVADTVGAGDAFCGALAAALASGADRRSALETANRAGADAVRWPGAQPDAAL
jgi:ribokinase